MHKEPFLRPYILRLFIALLCIAVCVSALSLLFGKLTGDMQYAVARENALHIGEISDRVREALEARGRAWLGALNAFTDGLRYMTFPDAQSLNGYLERFQQNSAVTDVCLYTDSGDCVNRANAALSADMALSLMRASSATGYTIRVLRSDISAFALVGEGASYNGVPIAAVSMYFSLHDALVGAYGDSFGGEGRLYLAQSDGVVIGTTAQDADVSARNLFTLYGEMDCTGLTETCDTLRDAFSFGMTEVVVLTAPEGDRVFAAVSRVDFGSVQWLLLYAVPETAVIRATAGFADTITLVGIGVIVLFALALMLTFGLYSVRYARNVRSSFNTREQMFNLLTTRTKYAFSLIDVDALSPIYLSPNAGLFLGGGKPVITHENGIYHWSLTEPNPNADFTAFNERLSQWNGTGEICSDNIRYSTYSGMDHYFTIRLFHQQTGEIVCVFQDVTEEQLRTVALQAAMQTAEQASAEKTRFLSNMSHDIRTPMNAILSMARFAQEEPENTPRYLSTIIDSTEQLRDLINDVLDISRIESGQVALNLSRVSVLDCVGRIIETMRPLCAGGKKQLLYETDVRHPIVEADEQKLRQIIMNLVNNAVKFTQPGGTIQVSVRETGAFSEGYTAFVFTVTDNGIGMSEQTRTAIFQPFVRADDNSVRAIEGTGLGLSIVKSYLDLMGGSVTVQSELNKGSAFIVSLPMRLAESDSAWQSSEAVGKNADISGLKVLVAEDVHVNRIIIEKLLASVGVSCEIAENGQIALDMFKASAPGRYDAVFMDIMMPVLDGLTAARRIRALERPDAAAIPIIALTANVFVEDKEKSREAGMNDHLGKPINLEEVRFVLAKVKTRAYSDSASKERCGF